MEGQIKALGKQYSEIKKDISCGNLSKAKRAIKKMQTGKRANLAQPYVLVLEADVKIKEGFVDEAIELIRRARLNVTTDATLQKGISKILVEYQLYDEYIDMYKQLSEKYPNDEEAATNYFAALIHFGRYEEAQVLSTKILKIPNAKYTFAVAGAAAYFRAINSDNSMFYRFACSYLDKEKDFAPDALEIKFNSLIKQNNYEAALTLLDSPQCKENMKHDRVFLIRSRIECLLHLDRKEEAVQEAVKFLREIHPDSIEEWDVIIKNASDPMLIINEFKDGRNRGPELAEIELAIIKNQDPMELISAFIQHHQGKPFLFHDIRKYLTPDIIARLPETPDIPVTLYTKGVINNDVSDQYTSVMIAQFYLKQYIETHDIANILQAIDKCKKYPESQECRLMLMRLYAIIGHSHLMKEEVKAVNIDGIQWLSFGNLFLIDTLRSGDLELANSFFAEVSKFVLFSENSFLQYTTGSIWQKNYLKIEENGQLFRQLKSHICFYLSRVYKFWYEELKRCNAPSKELDHSFLTSEQIDGCFDRMDKSCMPIYVNSPEVESLFYPSMITFVKEFSAAVRVISGLKIQSEDIDQRIQQLLAIEGISEGWHGVGRFFASGCEAIEPHNYGIEHIATMFIAAKVTGKLSAKVALDELLENYIANVRETLPIKDAVEDQIVHINETAVLLHKLLP